MAAALVVLGLAAVGAFFLHGRWSPPGGIHSLAVLPLKSPSGSADDESLGLGIADALIRRLSRTGAVAVRPMSAVHGFAKSGVDALTAARALNTDTVLEGSLQRAGPRLRVSVSLLRAQDGRSLWAESFDVAASEVVMVEDAVFEAVVSRLRLRIPPERRNRLKN